MGFAFTANTVVATIPAIPIPVSISGLCLAAAERTFLRNLVTFGLFMVNLLSKVVNKNDESLRRDSLTCFEVQIWLSSYPQIPALFSGLSKHC